eukprot:7808587-Pyramimonas_sp.AAC.1
MEHCGSDLHQATHWDNKHFDGTEINIKIGTATTTDYPRQRRYANFEDDLELYSGRARKRARTRQHRSAFTKGSFNGDEDDSKGGK